MNRFTYELGHKGSKQYDTNNTNDMPINNIWKAINKLGQLEDIEELIEKMYKQPIYKKCGVYIYERNYTTDKNILYNFKNKNIEIYEIIDGIHNEYLFVDELKVEGYGKTWALTREELEK